FCEPVRIDAHAQNEQYSGQHGSTIGKLSHGDYYFVYGPVRGAHFQIPPPIGAANLPGRRGYFERGREEGWPCLRVDIVDALLVHQISTARRFRGRASIMST